MGRRSITGGIVPSGPARIQFNFTIDGVRFRPTLPWIPNQVNLDHARKHLARIKAQIEARTFCFSEAFPDYRGLKRIPAFRVGVSNCRAQTVPMQFERTLDDPDLEWRARMDLDLLSRDTHSAKTTLKEHYSREGFIPVRGTDLMILDLGH